MGRRRAVRSTLMLAIFCAAFALLPGCTPQKAAKPPGAGGMKGAMPTEIEIPLTLAAGQSWKSRFVSSGELRQSYTGADGKAATRKLASGLELVAVQTVRKVDGSVARIEVDERSTKILQDGKFVEAPFRRFGTPNPVSFTIDTASGKVDFSAMEKAYADWMAGIKEGPAGEIMGKTFRVDAYVAQLKEIYAKPFNRFTRKKISKELRSTGEKDFALPFVGPGISMAPVPVETRLRFEGMEVKGGKHFLKVSGEYVGRGAVSREELDARRAELGAGPGKAGEGAREARGEFHSIVDVLSGREIEATSRVTYKAAEQSDGAYAEEVDAKLSLSPAD